VSRATRHPVRRLEGRHRLLRIHDLVDCRAGCLQEEYEVGPGLLGLAELARTIRGEGDRRDELLANSLVAGLADSTSS
jgi:hypothetical protein